MFTAIIYDYMRAVDVYTGFSPWFGGFVVFFFITSYIALKKKYLQLSLLIISTTIVTTCTLAGIRWGFDLPTVLLGYVLSIVLVGMIGSRKQNQLHLAGLALIMIAGYVYRGTLPSPESWYGSPFGYTDIMELLIIFALIASMLVFSHRAEQNLLDRAKRTEALLRKEKDGLALKVEEKVKELKQMQVEQLSTMYRFVEFGKISSGLFHDLMSPIQTLKIYMELFPKHELDPKLHVPIERMQKVSEKIEAMLAAMRTQVKFNQNTETFDLIQDIRDILLITRHLCLKHKVSIDIECESPVYIISTKRVILNHILLNLISNACEACDSKKQDNVVTIHIGQIPGKEQYKTYISVVDTGVGIATDKIPYIFDSFYSTKSSEAEATFNCGIGLSSAKHTLENHLQGKILVESEEGSGTTMTVLLPIGPQSLQSPQLLEVDRSRLSQRLL